MQNCLICLVDSLRYDTLPNTPPAELFRELGVEENLETPALAELLKRGTQLPNLHTTFPATPPAVASLLTGQYPREHGLCGFYRPLQSEVQTLADYFNQAGFHTIIMNGMQLFEKAGIQQRFDEHLQGPLARAGERITELNEADERVFVYLHTFDVHHPYLISKFPSCAEYHDPIVSVANSLAAQLGEGREFSRADAIEQCDEPGIPFRAHKDLPVWDFMHRVRREYIEREGKIREPIKLLADLYTRGISHFDQFQLAPLVEFLVNTSTGRDTLFLLTADHGELPRQGKNHMTFDHGGKPEENIVRVPGIVMNNKESLEFNSENQLTSFVDIVPTLLSEMSVVEPSGDFSGIDLHDESPAERKIYVEYSTAVREHEEKGEVFPRHALLEWQGILTPSGYKLYRRGEKLTEADYELPLAEFFRRALAKKLQRWPEDYFIDQCVKDFEGADNRQSREEFVENLGDDEHDSYLELYRWDKDPAETTNLLADGDSEKQKIARDLEADLCLRFPYPQELESKETELSGEEEDELRESLEGLGYL